jgi:hypothetical protein
MKTVIVACLLLLISAHAQARQHYLLIVSGIGGIDSYRQQFSSQAEKLVQAALDAGIDEDNIVVLAAQTDNAAYRPADKQTFLQTIREIDTRADAGDRVFVVLIGHGNARGDSAVFNLPGPDISADELDAALDLLGNRQLVVVNTASASGPFIKRLAASNRVVITATASGQEFHAPLFGEFFVSAFVTVGADRDKDERISMLEAFDFARRELRRSYDNDKRLLIEHALLDDNGDGEGSLEPGEYEADGPLANRVYLQQPRSAATGASSELLAMLQRKQALEQSIRDLKRQRDNLEQRDYYEQLENLLIELALLTRQIRAGDV